MIRASNYNYVCFPCRRVVRHPKTAKVKPRCLECGAFCSCIGDKVKVPKQGDFKAWRELEVECLRRDKVAVESKNVRLVRRRHFLEQEIKKLEEMPSNRERGRYVTKLKQELERLDENREPKGMGDAPGFAGT